MFMTYHVNKYVIKILNTIHVILIRPAKDFIFLHLARRLEKLPASGLSDIWEETYRSTVCS